MKHYLSIYFLNIYLGEHKYGYCSITLWIKKTKTQTTMLLCISRPFLAMNKATGLLISPSLVRHHKAPMVLLSWWFHGYRMLLKSWPQLQSVSAVSQISAPSSWGGGHLWWTGAMLGRLWREDPQLSEVQINHGGQTKTNSTQMISADMLNQLVFWEHISTRLELTAA